MSMDGMVLARASMSAHLWWLGRVGCEAHFFVSAVHSGWRLEEVARRRERRRASCNGDENGHCVWRRFEKCGARRVRLRLDGDDKTVGQS